MNIISVILSLAAITFIIFFLYLCVQIILEFSYLMNAFVERDRINNIEQLRKELEPEDFIKIMRNEE